MAKKLDRGVLDSYSGEHAEAKSNNIKTSECGQHGA
jgi:hypothetical protein